jgi:hypothetical protein
MRKPFAEASLGGKGIVVVDRVIIACEAGEEAELLIQPEEPLEVLRREGLADLDLAQDPARRSA